MNSYRAAENKFEQACKIVLKSEINPKPQLDSTNTNMLSFCKGGNSNSKEDVSFSSAS